MKIIIYLSTKGKFPFAAICKPVWLYCFFKGAVAGYKWWKGVEG